MSFFDSLMTAGLKQVWVIHARYQNYDGHCWSGMHTFNHLAEAREWVRKEQADQYSDMKNYVIEQAFQEE